MTAALEEPLTAEPDGIAVLEQRALAGDVEAFGLILREHDAHMRGLVWGMLRNVHDVDDVLQTAYEKAFVNLHRFNRNSSLKTWLHSICYRATLDHIKYNKRRRHQDLDTVINISSGADIEIEVENAIGTQQVIEMLNPEQRALILLPYAFGYTFDEVAEITGLRRGTVASRTSRLRAKIKGAMT